MKRFFAIALTLFAVGIDMSALAMNLGVRTAMWGVAAAQRQLSTPWVEDDSFNESVANVYDGWLVDENGDLAGIIQVKAAKQTVKNGATNFTATATVTDLSGKKWSYSKGVGTANGIVTGLISTAKGVAVASFGVELGLNGLSGEWGDCKIVGARNGMGVRGDSMMSALENGYLKKNYSVAFRDEFGVSRLQLVIGAKGVVKVTGNVAGGFKMNASVQGVMGENAFYVPFCAVLKSGKLTKSVSVLVRIAPNGAVEVLGNNLGDVIATGETLTFEGLDEEKTFYSQAETPSSGKEYRGQVVIPDLAYPAKFSEKGLPTGLKIDAATGVISGVPTKPGRYPVEFTVVSGLDSKSKVVVKFEIVVPNLKDDFISVEDVYGPYVPGVAYTNTIPAASGCAVSGLPAGMKWTAKDILDSKTKKVVIPANSAYGAPTKPGKYTVYFTKTVDKVKHTATATFIVGDYPVVKVENIGDGTGKVTGTGAFAANKSVTLKATADTRDDAKTGAKKSVFAGWYFDADGLDPVESTVDFRTASLPYVMTAEPETTLYAMFVTTEEDSDIALRIDGSEITVNAADNNFVADGTTILPLEMESISIPKASLSGLPAGMKYTDKALTAKATKTEEAYDVPANAIYGTPTKPGLYTVTVKFTNTTIKKAIEKKFTIIVPNYIDANHYFEDDYFGYDGNAIADGCLNLSVGITNLDDFLPSLKLNSATAKLAVSGLPSGLKYDAANGKLIGVATKPGTYTVTLTVTDGKAKYVSTITIEVEALPDWVVGTFDGYGVYNYPDCKWVDPNDEFLDGIKVTINTKGVVSVKYILDFSWRNVWNGDIAFEKDGDSYYLSTIEKSIYGEITEELTIKKIIIDGVEVGVITGIYFGPDGDGDELEGTKILMQNVWRLAQGTKLTPAFVKNTTSTISMNNKCDDDSEQYYGGYLTLKYGANGAVTTSYSETPGGKATATGSAHLVPYEVDGNITKAWLYTALKPKGRDPFGVLLFLSIDTSNGNVYGDDVIEEDYLLEVDD